MKTRTLRKQTAKTMKREAHRKAVKMVQDATVETLNKKTLTNIDIIDQTTVTTVRESDGEEWGNRECTRTDHSIRGFRVVERFTRLGVVTSSIWKAYTLNSYL